MNKFLLRVKSGKKKSTEQYRIRSERNNDDILALEEFEACWSSLEDIRRKARRSVMYAWGDQWGDLVRDPDTGKMITEGELIKKQGKVPLKNNMIAPILNNVEGQFRSNSVKPVCAVRDQRESKLGEMMSVAIEYVHDINEMVEVDVQTLKSMLTSGMMVQRLEYGPNHAKGNKVDVWAYDVNPTRVFFNTAIEDGRAWDLTHIGEIMDMPLEKVISEFAQSPNDEKIIRDIYGNVSGMVARDSSGLNGKKNRDMTFYTASQPDMCRVILGWRLESRKAYFYHDELKGEWGYVSLNEKNLLDRENEERRQKGLAAGVEEDDLLLINYEYMTELYWQYRYLTPDGYCLRKGRSPYWHGEHNYALRLQHFMQGKAYNFVEQFIDQQRAINRTATLIDFIRSASSKGVLVVDDSAFESMSREEIIDEYVRYNGVLFVKLKPGQSIDGVVRQYNGAAASAGDFELLNLQLRLINEISGVNSAMQGQAPKANTPASLYVQQVQNSSLNLRGLFDCVRAFRRQRDVKIMKMIQQYYDELRYLNIAGTDYSEEAKWYNPEKVRNADFDLTIADGNNTPAYQMLANDFLMELFKVQAIDAKTMLENSSYPFAAKILETMKLREQQMMEQQSMMQQQMMPVSQMPVNSPQREVAVDNGNSLPRNDGQMVRV